MHNPGEHGARLIFAWHDSFVARRHEPVLFAERLATRRKYESGPFEWLVENNIEHCFTIPLGTSGISYAIDFTHANDALLFRMAIGDRQKPWWEWE